MLISRSVNLLNAGLRYTKMQKSPTNFQQIRHSSWRYRELFPQPRRYIILTEVLGASLWWWVFWHLWHDYSHLIGHFPSVYPSQWTDEELGIPPDDYEE